MFDSLADRLGDIFDRLKRRGALSEADVGAALREVRVALLEADVALPVVKDFIAAVRERAVGAEVIDSVTPGQMVIKIVHDRLVEMLGASAEEINLATTPPAVIMMVGLQGSGKTTTTAKLALRLARRDKKKTLMASLDVRRPAAQEQLAVLGEQAEVDTLPIVAGQQPVDIAKRAVQAGRPAALAPRFGHAWGFPVTFGKHTQKSPDDLSGRGALRLRIELKTPPTSGTVDIR